MYMHLLVLSSDCGLHAAHSTVPIDFSPILFSSRKQHGLGVVYSRHYLVVYAFHQCYNRMHIKVLTLVHAAV